jgi:citrate lyase beta subunit
LAISLICGASRCLLTAKVGRRWGGVTQLDGKMLDKPHLRLAQRLLGA